MLVPPLIKVLVIWALQNIALPEVKCGIDLVQLTVTIRPMNRGVAIKYKSQDSSLIFTGVIISDNVFILNTNHYIYKTSVSGPILVKLGLNGNVLRLEDMSLTTLSSSGRDICIIDSGKILFSAETPGNLSGHSWSHAFILYDANHFPRHQQTGYNNGDVNGQTNSLPKISEHNNKSFGIFIHKLGQPYCGTEYALCEYPLYGSMIQHPSIKMTSLANKNNGAFVGEITTLLKYVWAVLLLFLYQ